VREAGNRSLTLRSRLRLGLLYRPLLCRAPASGFGVAKPRAVRYKWLIERLGLPAERGIDIGSYPSDSTFVRIEPGSQPAVAFERGIRQALDPVPGPAVPAA